MTDVVVRSGSSRGQPAIWSVPTQIRDLMSLNEWLATLPTAQRDVTEADFATGDGQWSAFGWGIVIPRENDNPDERDRVKREAAQSLAFVLLGFIAACPEGVVWRIRPELEWQLDPVTENRVITVYARIGSQRAAAVTKGDLA